MTKVDITHAELCRLVDAVHMQHMQGDRREAMIADSPELKAKLKQNKFNNLLEKCYPITIERVFVGREKAKEFLEDDTFRAKPRHADVRGLQTIGSLTRLFLEIEWVGKEFPDWFRGKEINGGNGLSSHLRRGGWWNKEKTVFSYVKDEEYFLAPSPRIINGNEIKILRKLLREQPHFEDALNRVSTAPEENISFKEKRDSVLAMKEGGRTDDQVVETDDNGDVIPFWCEEEEPIQVYRPEMGPHGLGSQISLNIWLKDGNNWFKAGFTTVNTRARGFWRYDKNPVFKMRPACNHPWEWYMDIQRNRTPRTYVPKPPDVTAFSKEDPIFNSHDETEHFINELKYKCSHRDWARSSKEGVPSGPRWIKDGKVLNSQWFDKYRYEPHVFIPCGNPDCLDVCWQCGGEGFIEYQNEFNGEIRRYPCKICKTSGKVRPQTTRHLVTDEHLVCLHQGCNWKKDRLRLEVFWPQGELPISHPSRIIQKCWKPGMKLAYSVWLMGPLVEEIRHEEILAKHL